MKTRNKVKLILAYILVFLLPAIMAWVCLFLCGYPAWELFKGLFIIYPIVVGGLLLAGKLLIMIFKYLLSDE